MLWQLEHGEHEAVIREQMRINKMPAPKWIAEKPELAFGLEFYFLAFWELNGTRMVTQGGEGPIPWTSYNEYGRRHAVCGLEFDRFVFVMRYMDNEYLTYKRKRSEKISAGLEKKAKKSPRPFNPREKKPLGH